MTKPNREVERFEIYDVTVCAKCGRQVWPEVDHSLGTSRWVYCDHGNLGPGTSESVKWKKIKVAPLDQAKAQALAEVRGALKPVIERLERIRDLDEQTSDGALGSLARHALDTLSTLEDTQGEADHG